MHRISKFFIFSVLMLFGSLSYSAELNRNLLHNNNDPYVGNPNAKIVLVEFFDYQCLHCSNMSDTMERIVKTNPNIKVIFKDYPIRGDVSEFAARAALAANKQGKYKAFHHELMNARQNLDQALVLQIASQNGLNLEKLKKDMNSKEIINQIEDNLSLAQEIEVNGTPAFVLAKADANNSDQLNIFLGEVSQTELQHLIQTTGH